MKPLTIAIAGANGYVGRHLIAELLSSTTNIKALVRKKNPYTEFSAMNYYLGDLLSNEGLDDFLANVDVAYYLVHNLESKNFAETEVLCAKNFVRAAQKANVKRIIYLSGLGDNNETLSEHLSSRHRVGELFRASAIESIELRSSAIFGAGSTSYELISCLVERLPIMILPRWVFNFTQPISIRDALYYLKEVSNLNQTFPNIIEIGGIDVVSYKDMMSLYATKRHLCRLMIPVPFLSLNLSSLWLHLFTPVHASVGRHLIGSLKNNTRTTDKTYLSLFPYQPMSFDQMINHAILEEQKEILSPQRNHLWRFDRSKRIFGRRFGRYLVRRDDILINASKEKTFSQITGLGGKNGWYFFDILWRLRAWFDRLIGGPGFSHGKSPLPLKQGDFVDCWRVEESTPNERLLLSSLMKMPGDAYLEFELISDIKSSTLLYQTALFRPSGLIGSFYWYLLYPLHIFLFKGLLRTLKRRAEPSLTPSIKDFLKHLFGVRSEETPSYEVFVKEGNMEIRRYEPYIEASVHMEGDERIATSNAFMSLARYIFGNNHRAMSIAMMAPVMKEVPIDETIPMTAPVLINKTKNDRIKMSFIMPKKYSLDKLPIPDDRRIQIEHKPEQWFAVITYAGRSNLEKEKIHQQKLVAWLLQQKGFELAHDKPLVAGFDPPWTFGPLRKNELMLSLLPNKKNNLS